MKITLARSLNGEKHILLHLGGKNWSRVVQKQWFNEHFFLEKKNEDH